MNNQQAAEILKAHNAWRRDDSENPKRMPNTPKVLGEAIDMAVQVLSQPEATELERLKEMLLYLYPWGPGMKYMCVDADGEVKQCKRKPTFFQNFWGSERETAEWEYWGKICVPEGIDWRDTLIERKEN